MRSHVHVNTHNTCEVEQAKKEKAEAEEQRAAQEELLAEAQTLILTLRRDMSQMRGEAEAARDVGGVKRLLVAMGRLSADELGQVTRHFLEKEM